MEHQEKTRDRNSYRQIEVFEPPEKLDSKWIGVGCVIKVERSGTSGNEPDQSISYYLCSLSPQSRRLADGIRGATKNLLALCPACSQPAGLKY